MTEEDLAAASVAAVIGTVTRIEAVASDPGSSIYTYVFVRAENFLFGAFPAETLVLRELGGRVGTRRQWVSGNPQYELGERVLVFVERPRSGRLRTTGMSMGKYRISVNASGESQATRQFGEGVAVLHPGNGRQRERRLRETTRLDRLVRRIRAATRGRALPGGGAVANLPPELDDPALLREASAAFTFLEPDSRWFEPDSGRAVAFGVDATGDLQLGAEVSQELLDDAFAAWSSVPGSGLQLEDAGPVAPAPFAGCPDLNRVVFNDPFDEIADPRGCRGVLALGGFCTSAEKREVNGQVFLRIVTGKVTFNDGWSQCPAWTRCNVAEVAAHEIGHALGFGHSTDATATMAQLAHFDGRCAALAEDDRDAARFAYPIPDPSPTFTPTTSPSPSVTPSPTGTPSPTRSGTRKKTPTRTPTSTRTRTPTRTGTATRTATATATRKPPTPASPTATATSHVPTATPDATPSRQAWLDSMRRALANLGEAGP